MRRHPVRDDIVVDLLVAGDLHQLHAARSPVTERLHPVAWPPLVLVLTVQVAGEVALALDEAKASRPVIHETIDPQLSRVAERTPDPLSVTGLRHQAVAVVHLRSIVVE